MTDLAIQLRVLMFALIFPFIRFSQDYGYDQAVALFAVVAMVLSIATSWCDARSRR